MGKPDKIIFLDIDGPMIPATKYLDDRMASFNQNLDERCVMVLKKIIEKSDAQIVFNSTHSNMLELTKNKTTGEVVWPGLVDQFIKAGFNGDIHPSVSTEYPQIGYTGFNHDLFDQYNIDLSECASRHQSPEHHPRMAAILSWLEKYKTDQMLWVALDDVYIPHKRAYTVSYDDGIGIEAYNHCAQYLNYRDFLYL